VAGFYLAGKIKRYYLAFEANGMYFAPAKAKLSEILSLKA